MSDPELKIESIGMPEGLGEALKAALEAKGAEAAAHDAAHMIHLLAQAANELSSLTINGFAGDTVKGILARIDGYVGLLESKKADTTKH